MVSDSNSEWSSRVDRVLGSQFKILVSRPDRLGDVILSTPVFEALKKHYPHASLTVLARKPVASLLQGNPSIDEVMIYDPAHQHRGSEGLFKLIREFRARQFQVSICLQSQWKIAAALYAAGVRYRVGPLSSFHSFLFYNRGLRQRRSQVEMHEADYNLQLLRKLGIRLKAKELSTQVVISESNENQAESFLKGFKDFILIHPGMGGSALNWPINHYVSLIRVLLAEGRKILISLGPQDLSLATRLKAEFTSVSSDQLRFFHAVEAYQDISIFGAVIKNAALVVAPSTGPLHLAVALDKRVITFFPPIRVQSAIRWGPYRLDDSKSSVFVPEVYCGQDFKCIGPLCNYYPCMESLSVPMVVDEIKKHYPLEDKK